LFSEPRVRSHLKNVYATLTMSVMASATGAYVHLFTDMLRGGGIVFSLLGAGLALGLFFTPDNGKNRPARLGMLLGFAFLTGLGLGPLLDLAIMMNPSIVPSALMLTCMVFACFSGAALFAPDGKYLYLGGSLLSGLSTLFFLGLLNIFFRSQLLFQAHLYLGLAIFCGFIMFDTQVIIEKARRGDKDFIAHSLDLFIDFIQIFRKVLIILMQKKTNKEESKDKKKR
ncbi:probable Bax inhibitor 1, partial [Eurytemora carolleeae]|uniref:probable Bax inhibitor 1 n=1 Tax=Eurytemora carolleeae TaxID=1294199 RepID=UPI000C778890